MKPLYFLTGNENKLRESQAILPNIEGFNLEILEMQHTDPMIIMRQKLQEAQKHRTGQFIVEDTSLLIEGMNGLPGPLIKWFEKTIGLEGIAKIAELYGKKAIAKVLIGYTNGSTVEFFDGSLPGMIVSPRGTNGFGWDKIFIPNGYDRTFAEMTAEEKNKISMRKIAFEKLRIYLSK